MRILVLNGPNLNMLGKRDPKIYGTRTLKEIVADLTEYAEKQGVSLDHIQSNYEGRLIDELCACCDKYDGVLLNAGALTHYSYSIRDSIECCGVPVIEVHMSNILEREPFRAVDVIESVCVSRVMGSGEDSYRIALDEMIRLLKRDQL